ncbi:MAG: hypothetical protein PHW79_09875 [Candidatus Marinimicrobia bacterium]|nr:hypothetical protein [Candidatus Neomarinimicrobiota bacterium]
MGCSCCEQKIFTLNVLGKDRQIAGLDEIVFMTAISFPENDAEAAEMLWEQAKFSNDLTESEKEAYLPALLEFYHHEKDHITGNVSREGCGGGCDCNCNE